MKNLEDYKEEAKKKAAARQIRADEMWDNLTHFETPHDVPDIPKVETEIYQNFYVPKLINAGAIPKKDLIDNQVYIGNHRRCTIARWNAKNNNFEYWRYKFGTWFHDTCNHFEDDNGFALFVPIKLGKEEDFKIPEN